MKKAITSNIGLLVLILVMIMCNSITIEASDFGGYYKKAMVKAEKLYVIDMSNMNSEEKMMISSLQGLLANQSTSQIYITDTTDQTQSGFGSKGYTRWLNLLESNEGVTVIHESNPWHLLSVFNGYFNGYILYDFNTSSMNVASSLAGVLNSIPISTGLESKALENNISMTISVQDRDEQWLINNYWAELNHKIVIEAKEDSRHALHLRDYAAMSKAIVFFDGNSYFRTTLMGKLDDDAVVLGWGDTSGGSEEAFISNSSSKGVQTQPADWAMNLSTLSGFERASFSQGESEFTAEENVHYVCFYVSDGDNIQWTLNRGNKSDWWGSSYRGKNALGWTIPPSLADLAPTSLGYYYDTMSSKDNFIIGPSGNGFIFPGSYPEDELEDHLTKLNSNMQRLDTNIVGVIGRNSFRNNNLWLKYTDKSQIDGVFYYEWSPYFGSPHQGDIVWSNNKPVIATRYKLATGLNYATSKYTVIQGINNASRNVHDKGAYSLICVDAWNNYELPKTIDEIIQSFNSDVRVVTPRDFIGAINENIRDYNPGGGSNPTPTEQSIIDISQYFNIDGFSYDTNKSDGRYDNGTQKCTYPADELGNSLNVNSIEFQFGPFQDGENNAIEGKGQEININRQGTKLYLLGSATEGDQSNQVVLNYEDGSTVTTTLSQKDWCTSNTSGHSIAKVFSHRHNNNTNQTINTYIFEYYFELDDQKILRSITLPQNNNQHVLAMTIVTE